MQSNSTIMYEECHISHILLCFHKKSMPTNKIEIRRIWMLQAACVLVIFHHFSFWVIQENDKKHELRMRLDKDYSLYSVRYKISSCICVRRARESWCCPKKILTAENNQILTEEGIPNYTSDADILKASILGMRNQLNS